jgi:hypothetical protein
MRKTLEKSIILGIDIFADLLYSYICGPSKKNLRKKNTLI